MYDNGYVRLTALRRDAMPFSPTLRSALPPSEGITSPFASLFPPLKGGRGMFLRVRSFVIQSEAMNLFFCHFWLDPKVTKRSRLRALHTPSRRLQVGKSGNSLRSDSLIFFRPARCSVGSPPEAEGTNAGINCQWLFSRYMIRRVPRITIDNRITSGLQPSAEMRCLFPQRFALG